METRANYVVIGLFTLAVIVGAFGFIYWFNTIGGAGERATYRIVFDSSVSGLRTGASVLFNGIRVGEVTELKLDPAQPRAVVAMVSLEKNVSVRADTAVSLEYQGVTGTASIALRGGSDASPLAPGNPPTLKVDAAGAQDVTQAAREAMRRIDQLVADNETVLKGALQNIEVFSQTLATNSAAHRQHPGRRRGPARRRRRQARRHRAGGARHQDRGREPRRAQRRDLDRARALLNQRLARMGAARDRRPAYPRRARQDGEEHRPQSEPPPVRRLERGDGGRKAEAVR